MAFPPLGNSEHVVSVSIDLPSNSQGDALFHHVAYDYSGANWDRLRDHLRDVPWKDAFKLGPSAVASQFSGWVQVGIHIYIPHKKYQVKSYSSPCFSAACTAAIVHRSNFFLLYQKDKPSDSKESSDRLVIVAKGFLKLPNLHMLIKQKSQLLPENLALMTFG